MINLPHFVSIAPDNVVEYYVDHTILSTARMCESRFMLEHVSLYRPKGMPWALDFGILIHHCMEFYYSHKMKGTTLTLRELLEFAAKLWREGNYDRYSLLPQYKAVGGQMGFLGLLTQYFNYYAMSDNLKPIALEVAFGRNKEVALLDDDKLYSWAPFRLYLSGRMDVIYDDGRRIGPMDHKSFSMAGKNPMTTYEVQEGMTGYCYAMTELYSKLKASLHPDAAENYSRETNVVWMNFILTAAEADPKKRFQRIPLYKTKEQLEDYRLRQISTVAKIHSLLFGGRPPDFNASVCNNYWHSICPFQPVHRLGTAREQLIILKNDFVQGHVWNPETVEGKV